MCGRQGGAATHGTRYGCRATPASRSSRPGRTAREGCSSCAPTEVTCIGWRSSRPSSSHGPRAHCRGGAADCSRTVLGLCLPTRTGWPGRASSHSTAQRGARLGVGKRNKIVHSPKGFEPGYRPSVEDLRKLLAAVGDLLYLLDWFVDKSWGS